MFVIGLICFALTGGGCVFAVDSASGAKSMQELMEGLNPVTEVPTTEEPPKVVPLQQRINFDPLNNVNPQFNLIASNDVSKSIFDLGNILTKQLLQTRNSKFEVISPLSIAAALNVVLLGAKGDTFNELLKTLGYSKYPTLQQQPYKIHEEFGFLLQDLIIGENPTRPRPQHSWKHKFFDPPETFFQGGRNQRNRNNVVDEHKIAVANGLFVQQGYTIRPDFMRVARTTYQCEITNLDFQLDSHRSAEFINNWVKKKTFGLVPKIVGETIDPDTRVIIANAVYFKAEWHRHFIEGATGWKPFYPDGKQRQAVNVEMMGNGGRYPYYASNDHDCEILGLPYKGNQSTMYIILPRNSNRANLINLQSRLTSDVLEDMISRMTLKSSVVVFPKLHLDQQVNLRDTLAQLGVQSLFTPHRSDLSLISTPDSGITSGVNYQPLTAPNQGLGAGLTSGTNHQPIQPSNSLGQGLTSGTVDISRAQAYPLQQGLTNGYVDSSRMDALVDGRPNNLNQRLVFSRLGEEQSETEHSISKRQVSYKVESSNKNSTSPLNFKDFILNKRIYKKNPNLKKPKSRGRRQVNADPSFDLRQLDQIRNSNLRNPGLFADDVLHRVNLIVNERGTEAGAVTAITLNRSGPQVFFRADTPFLILIRHDPTRLPLFYAAVFEPVNV